MSKILLIDGYNIMHRARFSFNRGDFHIVFNFARAVKHFIETHKADLVYFVLEGAPSENLVLLPDYKGNRRIEETDPKYESFLEFQKQKKYCIELTKNLPIITAFHPENECDDTLAAIARMHKDDDVVILSSDSDFIQVLQTDSHIKIFHPIRKTFIEAPEYDYVEWKALAGDSTDNIPGIPRVGSKTAIKLLTDKELFKKKIINNQENLDIFNRNLKLVRFFDVDIEEIIFTKGVYTPDYVYTTFKEMKFNSLLKKNGWNKFSSVFKDLDEKEVYNEWSI